MQLAITTYSFVLALHIMVVLAAFGLPLAYPLLLPYVRANHPRAMPGVHDVQHRLNQRLTAPGTILILVFGAYLASKGHYWSKVWVDVPIAILVIIGGLGGAVVVPLSARLSELAGADVAATPSDAEVTWSAEHERVFKRYMGVERLLGALVLVAVFFMAAKPFA